MKKEKRTASKTNDGKKQNKNKKTLSLRNFIKDGGKENDLKDLTMCLDEN